VLVSVLDNARHADYVAMVREAAPALRPVYLGVNSLG
jgi:hypothetical protein